MTYYECTQCYTAIPIERRSVATHFAHLCTTCASAMDYSIKNTYASIPLHKGAYHPVTTRQQVYEVGCSPKNYDHELSKTLGDKNA